MPTARRVDGPQQSAFEIERFGFDGDARLEVSGRWFGVRGRNFVRPVLTVDVGGEPRRLVALLDHEPWNAADGERWIAAFPWEGPQEAAGPAVLEVGSLNVDLPVPGAESGVAGSVQHRPSRRPAPVAPWGDDAPPPPPRRSGERHTRVMPPRGPKETPAGLAEPDVDSALERDLAAARAEALRLRERYESNAEALRAGERADEAQASLGRAETEIYRLRQAQATAHAEIARLRHAQATAHAEIDRLREAGAGARSEGEQLRTAVREARDAAAEAHAELERVKEAEASARAEIAQLRASQAGAGAGIRERVERRAARLRRPRA